MAWIKWFDGKWPKQLTDAAWQKAKGKIAKKTGGKTGVGAALKRAEGDFKSVDWNLMVCKKHLKYSDVDEQLANAQKVLAAKGPKIKKSIYAARDLAKTCAAKYKKSKLVPSSATKAALKLAKDLQFFGDGFNKCTWDDFKRRKVDIEKKFKMIVGVSIKKFYVAIKNCEKTPTVADCYGHDKPIDKSNRALQVHLRNYYPKVGKIYFAKLQQLYALMGKITVGGPNEARDVKKILGQFKIIVSKVAAAL